MIYYEQSLISHMHGNWETCEQSTDHVGDIRTKRQRYMLRIGSIHGLGYDINPRGVKVLIVFQAH
jgi:hypothetical protein